MVIVTAYHNREKELLNTLDSFKDYKDIEVIIVNDSEPLKLKNYDFNIQEIRIKKKTWINPCVNFNIGFLYAMELEPDAVIIQNPECYHRGDIVGTVRERLTDKNYLSFGCYSLGKNEGIDFQKLNNRTANHNGDSAWYNHSIYRPEALHFCCAIKTVNLRKINGFDENFADGLGYEDNYFVHQVKTLGLKIEFVDNPYVLHQYHYDKKAFDFDADLFAQTGKKYEEMKRLRTYRAVHPVTKTDL